MELSLSMGIELFNIYLEAAERSSRIAFSLEIDAWTELLLEKKEKT
jgi:hypothetical protein